MITSSADRVSAATAEEVNDRIARQTEASIAYHGSHPDRIERRLHELDAEWDIERAIQVNSSALTLTGLVLSVVGGRKWLLLPLTVQSFLMQHAIQGWCPPVPLLRRMGIRTQGEIERERYALKALRGDFRDVTREGGAERVIEAVH
jgi:hypothetical protein